MKIGIQNLARLALCSLAAAMAFVPLSQAFAAQHATILMYHRFGDDRYPSTNVRVEQFEEHLETLSSGDFTVWPLDKIVQYMQDGKELPDRTVAITVDDAYLSFYEVGYPLLEKYGFVATLFVATEPVDKGYPDYMSWNQIREVQRNGIVIGSQTRTHPHMHRLSYAENLAELTSSNETFIDEVGQRPELFAYPYGEYSLDVIKAVKETGFTAAFGQHSGIASGYDGFYQLPRFPINERYAGAERMKTALNGLPLTVSDVLPKDVVLDQNPPHYGFTLSPDLVPARRLQCFNSQYGQLDVKVLERRVEIRIPGELTGTRPRVNCTIPEAKGRWRWFGRQFLTK